MDKVCGDCIHYLGGGDWDLCCDVHHPTSKEQEQGVIYLFGHLCYEDTLTCDMFEEKVDNRN